MNTIRLQWRVDVVALQFFFTLAEFWIDALFYQRAISAAEVATLYVSSDSAGNNGPACSGSTITLSAITLSGATYSWTGPNGLPA
ncbi:MAG: hypothetical protein ABJA70_23415 [Chryseolinea sp.]